jgi:sugar (pentulose or hexulose) kinase
MTADATGLRVVAGPIEATASGNILAQMLAFGEINSLAEGRQILQRSFNPVVHEPKNTAAWAQKDGDFEKMCALSKR